MITYIGQTKCLWQTTHREFIQYIFVLFTKHLNLKQEIFILKEDHFMKGQCFFVSFYFLSLSPSLSLSLSLSLFHSQCNCHENELLICFPKEFLMPCRPDSSNTMVVVWSTINFPGLHCFSKALFHSALIM